VTIKPSVLGGRILRLLEVVGLSHKVTIKVTVNERISGHNRRSTRTIRVI
jgi:hypothetical protein